VLLQSTAAVAVERRKREENDVKISMLIVAGAATAALSVPVASGAIDRSLPWDATARPHSGQTLSKQLTGGKKTGGAGAAQASKAPGTAPVTNRVVYIYVPSPPTATIAPVAAPDNCMSSDTDCTVKEACEIWGENCSLYAQELAGLPPAQSALPPEQSAPTA
jgi:hypothetical protein